MVNLNERISDMLQSAFTTCSLVTGKLTTDYEFDGAKSVKVITPLTIPMTDYNRAATANRYGTPAEMQDLAQVLTLTQDKAFALTVDKGNLEDQQFIKQASTMLMLQVSERAIPEMDGYIFSSLAQKAGKIVGSATAPTKSTICSLISAATEYLDDAEVPQNDRTLFLSASLYNLLKHSDEYMQVNEVGREALRRGEVGSYDNMAVVKVPKKRWPQGVNFMVVHKSAATAPVKMDDTHIHKDPPGISGSLIEGRQYYDLFVFGAKCDGVYVHVNTGGDGGKLCATPTITAASGAISCSTAGAVIRYTTDGTDPRYSDSAKTGTQSDVTAAGTVIRAYAFKDEAGFYPSEVASAVKS